MWRIFLSSQKIFEWGSTFFYEMINTKLEIYQTVIPKFAQCETRSKKFQVMTGLQTRQPKQKILNYLNFSKINPRNLVTMIYTKDQYNRKAIEGFQTMYQSFHNVR